MSIVEKAAEKLKTLQPEPVQPGSLQPEPPASPAAEPAAPHHSATIELLHERVRTAEHAVETAPPWHVNLTVLERRGLLPIDDEARGRLDDELRRIKRPLLSNAIGRGVKAFAHPERIVVTSAVPAEGKTFTAINLALSLARELDFEVVLVDGDVPKADVTRAFQLDGKPGLLDVLVDGGRHPSEVIMRTDVPNLRVVPVGSRHPLAAELFGSLRMEYVLAELGGRNQPRLVVFDSAPLLASAESQVLASHMGQVVMVVAAGRTRQHEVNSALRGLDDSQYVGLLLNMSRLPASENPYYKYYGYSGQDPGKPEGEA